MNMKMRVLGISCSPRRGGDHRPARPGSPGGGRGIRRTRSSSPTTGSNR